MLFALPRSLISLPARCDWQFVTVNVSKSEGSDEDQVTKKKFGP